MKLATLILLTSCPVLLPGQIANQATLTLVEEDGFNEVDIGIDVDLIGASDDQSDLTGTLEVGVNLLPGRASTDEFTIFSADVTGTDIQLRAGFLVRYNFTGTDIGLSAATITPPGVVDPETGEFEANQHRVTTTSGMIDGSAAGTSLPEPFDFSTTPFSGEGEGTGTITVTPGRIEGRLHYFDLSVELPVSLEQTVEVEEGLPIAVTVDVAIDGRLKAVGETFIDVPDFETWAVDLGFAPDSENANDISPTTPNYLFFALGFDAATAPSEILQFGPEGVTLQTSDGFGLGAVEVQWSDNLIDWERVPEESMSSGSSRLNFGEAFTESPVVRMEDAKKYLRVVKPEAL